MVLAPPAAFRGVDVFCPLHPLAGPAGSGAVRQPEFGAVAGFGLGAQGDPLFFSSGGFGFDVGGSGAATRQAGP